MKKNILTTIVSFIITLSSFPLFSQKVIIDGVPRDTSYTVSGTFLKEKKYFPIISVVDTVLPKGLLSYENIAYKKLSESRELTLSIYRPDDKQTYPVVLMIHGGGWNSGTPDMQKAFAINLAKKGFVTATVEYSLIPEALYPAAVDDLNDAVSWIVDNSNKYNIDAAKLAVAGGSAGGHLAGLIGTKNINGCIKAVVNIDGITTFVHPESIDRAELAKQKGETLPIDAVWLGGTYSDRSDVWKDASSLFWVNENSAPMCFINSSIPRFHNGREEYIQKLDSLNIYSVVHEFESSPHTFWHFHPWHLTAVGVAANFLNNVFGDKADVQTDAYDIIVAQDGSGDYLRVQDAIDAVPDFRKKPTKIFIRNGFYHEKIVIPETKQDLFLIGEDKFKTIISYNNYASKQVAIGGELGTSGSASVYVTPNRFTAENITFENAAGPVGQAVAVIVRSDEAQFFNCRFLGFQDTLYTHKPGSKQYYNNCYIEGTVDFIFGASTAYFEECDIFCKNNGYITAASTPENQDYGYVFNKCRISGESKNSFFLGRPWRPFAHVAFIECDIDDIIKPERWNNWGRESNEQTAKYLEYGNTGLGSNIDKRVPWAKQLNKNDLEYYHKSRVLGVEFMNL